MSEANELAVDRSPTTILARYEAGETIAEIAKSYGLKGGEQLYRLLIEAEPDRWKAYQSARALRRLEQATMDLENANDVLSLARAREQVKAAQWELERLLRRIYGQDHASSGAAGVQINIGIGVRQHDPITVDAQVVESKHEGADK